tara:strand:+ start:390 stop:668 length:279 start_codon:yes stop_codon:yes gene_type:complete
MASHYEKQQMQINEFERINRKQAWEKRNPHLRELTMVEKIIQKSKEQKEAYQKKLAKKPKQVFISHYNPNNPLNGSSSWNKEQMQAYKDSLK